MQVVVTLADRQAGQLARPVRQVREGRGVTILDCCGCWRATWPWPAWFPKPPSYDWATRTAHFTAMHELPHQGGAGLIEPLFGGRLAGVSDIPSSSSPATTSPTGTIAAMLAVTCLLASTASPLTNGQVVPARLAPTKLRTSAMRHQTISVRLPSALISLRRRWITCRGLTPALGSGGT